MEQATHLTGLYLEREIGTLGITQAEAHTLARLASGGSTSPNELHRLFGHKFDLDERARPSRVSWLHDSRHPS
jgi:hypothetical protein